MLTQYTFSMIKPDATKRNLTGKINSYLEDAGLKIVAQKMVMLTRYQAENFYQEHSNRPFFEDLVSYIISGPVVLQVLKGKDAVTLNRKIMGSTDPQDAAAGTIRKDFGNSIEENSIHGSDNQDSAKREIKFFFATHEIVE